MSRPLHQSALSTETPTGFDRSRKTRLDPGGFNDEAPIEVIDLMLRGEDLVVLRIGPVDMGALASLTTSEREVVRLALTGATNAEVALARGTSIRTVANQLSAVYQKLGVTSRVELTARLAGSAR